MIGTQHVGMGNVWIAEKIVLRMLFHVFHSLSSWSSNSTLTLPSFTKPSVVFTRSRIGIGTGHVVSGEATENTVETPQQPTPERVETEAKRRGKL
jgi:hypothetical protein